MKIADYLAPRRSGPTPERSAFVSRVLALTPQLRRIELEGEGLCDFRSDGFDDHIRLGVPQTHLSRRYTIRAHDRQAGRMVLDMVQHGAGPAALWAAQATPGERVTFTGPKIKPGQPRTQGTLVLMGDATALPAIARCLENAAAIADRVIAHVALGQGTRPDDLLACRPQDRVVCHMDELPDHGLASLRRALRHIDWAGPDMRAWIAAEHGVARALRADLLEEEAMAPRNVRAAAYWQAGVRDGAARL